MNDKNMIITGLIIFCIIIIFPFLYNLGSTAPPPEPVLSEKAKAAGECIAPKEVIRAEHMEILGQWRYSVVRNAKRIYKASNGKEYNMSLSSGENSCIGCHTNKAEFCDKCHNYASVEPYCWDCHIEPKERN